jgi:hypothetical protein
MANVAKIKSNKWCLQMSIKLTKRIARAASGRGVSAVRIKPDD